MFLKTITLSSVALLIASAGYVATSDTEAHSDVQHKSEAAHHNHHAGYVKPGAGVAITHDYDGQTHLGELETVTLTLSHLYEDGALSVDILPTENLQIFSNMPVQGRLYHGSTLSLPIQVSGTLNGTYSIAIEAVYNSPQGQQSRRVLSIPITIGEIAAGKTQRIPLKTEKSKAEGFIALPAKEVIR